MAKWLSLVPSICIPRRRQEQTGDQSPCQFYILARLKKIFPSYEGPNCVLIFTVFSIAVRNNGNIVLVLACLEFELTTSTNKIVNYANDMANSEE